MLFVILLSIVQAKKSSKSTDIPLITPIPISVPIDAMESNLNFNSESDCNTDISCNSEGNLYNPQCGAKCYSHKNDEDYLQYTFKGVKFDIYGSKAENNGIFSLMLNGTEITKVNLTHSNPAQHRVLVYESEILEYGTHTVRVQSIANNQFEIHKFTFWPSFQAIRFNISELNGEGSWTVESDKIGGVRTYTNDNNNPYKRTAYAFSKMWIYGTNDPNHGTGIVEYAGITGHINQTATPRKSLVLAYESERVPFNTYQVTIRKTSGNAFMVSCIYFLNDAPPQTPAPNPSKTKNPGTADTYIGKTFREVLPDGQILLQQGTNIKQISGCHFININVSNINYFIRPQTPVDIDDNIFEYTDLDSVYSGPIFADIDQGSLTISNCRFIKSRTQKVIGGDGNVLSSECKINIKFDSCQFINCGKHNEESIIRQQNPESSLELYSCSFSFDNADTACKAVEVKSSNLKVRGCTFDNCGPSTINIQTVEGSLAEVFEFTNNIVQNAKSRCILTTSLRAKPIINDNIFRNINIENSYFISVDHNEDELTLFNNTFSDITSTGTDIVYGGGVSLWIARSEMQKCVLTFDQCKFTSINNNKNTDPYQNGGALQFGHSFTIANIQLIFTGCEFKGNRCLNGNGGALAIDINNSVQISNCIFENNEANGNGGSIYVWGKLTNNNQGGTDTVKMDSILINNCQFTRNKGNNGHILYTEEDDLTEVQLEISSCIFTNNGEDSSKYMIINNCKDILFEHNIVEYTDISKSSGLFILYNTDSTINNCTIRNAKTDSGCIKLSGYTAVNAIIKKCELLNCKSGSATYAITLMEGVCDFDSIIISFDSIDEENGGGINFEDSSFTLSNCKFTKLYSRQSCVFSNQLFNHDPISITGCTFDNCEGLGRRCFYLQLQTQTATFRNNTIQNMQEFGKDGYFGSIDFYNQAPVMKFEEVLFINNRCSSSYGGGSGLWVTKISKLEFTNCQFINNVALQTESRENQLLPNGNYYNGDGGGIQWGFSQSIYNVDISFSHCLFRQNKAVRHGGAIALQTLGTVEINHCMFEDNIANFKPQSAEVLEFENHYSKKSEGRGGAIYLNPAFYHTAMPEEDKNKHMENVKIDSCSFQTNDAYDGYAIYIEGEDPGNTLTISNNTFTDNHDGTDKQKSMIISEIPRLSDSEISNQNSFSNTNPDISIPPVVIVDNDAVPIISETPIPEPEVPTVEPKTQTPDQKTQTQKPSIPNPDVPTGDEDGDEDIFDLINTTSKGRHEYVITEPSSTLILIFVSHFYNIRSAKKGGAIHITNAGIICNNTHFENCTSNIAGGGIYLYNTFKEINKASIFYNNFTQCKASYGGGIYIFSTNRKNNVQVKMCTFLHNEATAKKEDGGKYGGSGIYATIRKGKIDSCNFNDITTGESVLKYDNDYTITKSSLSLLNLKKQSKPFIVSNCHFQFLDNENAYGVYYVRGKSDILVELSDCIFTGKLEKNSNYIGGEIISNSSPKMIVKNCKFPDRNSNPIILDSSYLSVESDSEKNHIVKSRSNAFAVVVSVTTVAVVAILGLTFFVVGRKKTFQSKENEMSSGLSSCEEENDI